MRGSIETRRLSILQNITDLLSRTFPSQFVFPVLGHEDGQGHGINFRTLGELWRHWLPNEALETFNKGKQKKKRRALKRSMHEYSDVKREPKNSSTRRKKVMNKKHP